ncbi:MAG TPA: MASE4 domain-containing protein [Burkholderiales bacterium]|nr:MASE4 domain-containing protein [Burkholderiales bacterium]
MTELGEQSRAFLSAMAPGRRERRLAFLFVVGSAVLFLALVPFAKWQLAAIPTFVAIHQGTLVTLDVITAVLLLGLYAELRSPGLLALGCGYAFTATIAILHALTFPGLFAPTGLLGAGPQTTSWLYVIWHGGFPLVIIIYALSKRDTGPPQRGSAVLPIFTGLGFAGLASVGAAVLTTEASVFLPEIVEANRYTAAEVGIVSSIWALSLLALAVLWWRRPHSLLDLWLMVTMCAWTFDIALTGMLSAARFDLGFYAGRIYGLMASSFVLIVLLTENAMLRAERVSLSKSERSGLLD